jgi:hypothetical protein
MLASRFFAVGISGLVALVSASRHARAEADAAPPEPYRFEGLAIYAAAGGGFLPGVDEPTMNARLLATFPVAPIAMIEAYGTAYRLKPMTHHGTREESFGLAFGAGARFAPPPGDRVRPHIAARVAHLHLEPDPWGDHEGTGADISAHDSAHRFGAGLGVGFEAALGRASRWRIGAEVEGMAMSGPGPTLFVGAVATLGLGL